MTARTSRPLSLALCTAAVCGAVAFAPRDARAQADVTVRPHLLFALDTSGSMTCDINSRGGADCDDPLTQAHSPTANSCGVTYRSRINDLRCVMTNVVNNVSDAIIGIGRFRTTTATCGTYATGGTPATQCGLSGSDNTFCRGTDAMTLIYPLIDTGVAPAGYPTNRATIVSDQLEWFDAVAPGGLCTQAGACNNAGNADIGTSGNTPLGGILDGARIYFSTGLTTVGGLNDRVVDNRTVPSPITSDPIAACRPRAVVLITDGDETCSGNAPAAATALRTLTVGGQPRPVLTYVVAMGTAIPYGPVESIATSGGTTNPRRGTRAFYANSEAELAIAISDIIADSQLREFCNGVDDNCNMMVDEGYNVGTACAVGVGACRRTGTIACVGGATSTASACNVTAGAPGAENTVALCSDGLDNDCDGLTDCADPNCAAIPRCSGSCVPSTEICNGRDDDCDMMIDEGNPGGGTACGLTLGACRAGTTACTGGAIVCVGAVSPVPETCNNIDDDCDGAVDDGDPGGGGACATGMSGVCSAGTRRCVSGALACVPNTTATPEVCDGIDNDCDGTVDDGNPGGGAPCGSATGICTRGVVQCTGGSLMCTGGTRPRAEICNGLDDDCNGVADDGVTGSGMNCTPTGIVYPSTPPVGACRFGTTVCSGTMGSTCTGGVGPTAEVCNGIDDDCDGMTDEGLDGMACGSAVGACRPGVMRCVAGRPSCDGSVGPGSETCNGLDDDCDGEVDEGNPGGGTACGSMVGECAPGVNACRGGAIVCDGGRLPTAEVCDGLDNDCDGMIDEEIALGAPCGSMVGECRAGTQRCSGGRVVCDGEVGPRPEECNCRDDDCNGMIDDLPAGGSPLCGEGSVCAGAPHCGCLRPCGDSEFPCPVGRVCQPVDGRDLCVGDLCEGVTCNDATETCVGGACRARCDGVMCTAPQICNPRSGRCVENGCRALENCAAGEICRGNRCQADPCRGVMCAMGQACYDGTCGASCAGVTCPSGQSCFQGTCRAAACVGVTCAMGQVCSETNGMCTVDRCTNRRCGRDQTCDSATGECVDDPCAVVDCPAGQTCSRGSCSAPPEPPRPPRDRVIGSGGGCAVAAPGAGGSNTGALALGALSIALAAASRRRRARRAGVSL